MNCNYKYNTSISHDNYLQIQIKLQIQIRAARIKFQVKITDTSLDISVQLIWNLGRLYPDLWLLICRSEFRNTDTICDITFCKRDSTKQLILSSKPKSKYLIRNRFQITTIV